MISQSGPQSISSDVMVIHVNQAGFTVCLFYGAVGRTEHGPSMRAPAGSRTQGGSFDEVRLDTSL